MSSFIVGDRAARLLCVRFFSLPLSSPHRTIKSIRRRRNERGEKVHIILWTPSLEELSSLSSLPIGVIDWLVGERNQDQKNSWFFGMFFLCCRNELNFDLFLLSWVRQKVEGAKEEQRTDCFPFLSRPAVFDFRLSTRPNPLPWPYPIYARKRQRERKTSEW